MTSEVIDVQATPIPEPIPPSRALSIQTVALPVSVDEAIRQWDEYQELTRRLLNKTDYQKIGNKEFKKKSAWRKYAKAFNISDHVTFEEINRADDGFPLWARIRVEAYHPATDRRSEADHEVHVLEKCCIQPCSKRSWNNHFCCPAECDGRRHWSHPGDLPATALTRAKNRAISDLIGAGEVSAEEMTPDLQSGDEKPTRTMTASEYERTRGAVAQIVDGPKCAKHGPLEFVPGGTSTKNGRKYDAFWGCLKTCKEDAGKSVIVDDSSWQAMKAANTPTEKPDYDDVPYEGEALGEQT